MLDALPVEVAVLDGAGVVTAVNAAWRRFAEANEASAGVQVGIGIDYLEVCRPAVRAGDPHAFSALEAIRAVLEGREREVTCEYPCHAPAQPRWFLMRVVALPGGGAVVSHTDVTERTVASAPRDELAELLRGFYEASPQMIGVAEIEGEQLFFVHANAAAGRALGRAGQALAGQSALALGVPEAVQALWLEQCRRCRLLRAAQGFEYEHPGRDGPRWLKASVAWLGVSTAGRDRFSFVCEDITERVRIEAVLRDRESRLRLALDSAQLGMHVWDPVHDLLHWDARVRELWGVSADEPVDYRLFLAGVHPDDRERVDAAARRALEQASGGLFIEEYRVIGRDDKLERWVRATGQVTFVGGRAVRLAGTVQDITERKSTETALRQREQDLATAFRVNPQPMFIVRVADGRYIEVNEPWERLTGYARAEAIGRTSLELGLYGSGEDRARFYATLRREKAIRDFEFDTLDRSP